MTRLSNLTRAAEMAARVLLARHIDALPVDPLAILRACQDTRVYTRASAEDVAGSVPDALLADADAVTLRMEQAGKLHYIVIYRADGNPARLRFTLAHELGHRLLGHRGSGHAEEQEADCFASHLLCPEAVVEHFRSCCADDAEVAQRIAVTCYVSRSCARMALRRERVEIARELQENLHALLAGVLAEGDGPKGE